MARRGSSARGSSSRISRADGLLSVQRPRLHDRLSNRRHHASAGSVEVAIDASTCIGCGNCVKRCPWGNILTVPFDSPKVGERINLATMCDLCIGRRGRAGCVQMCPQGCAQRVSFKDSEQVTMLFSG